MAVLTLVMVMVVLTLVIVDTGDGNGGTDTGNSNGGTDTGDSNDGTDTGDSNDGTDTGNTNVGTDTGDNNGIFVNTSNLILSKCDALIEVMYEGQFVYLNDSAQSDHTLFRGIAQYRHFMPECIYIS